ncbi:hypothetical protein ACFV3R_32245 [Streptomyces sp. NPDC059740]|uniref:hypothetical protein n=1 Tax=Streptomyces sp. NPDC059740 TaxID=3346926 RepID=UPI0036693DF9
MQEAQCDVQVRALLRLHALALLLLEGDEGVGECAGDGEAEEDVDGRVRWHGARSW